jgi:protein-disulfide isomerase
MLCVLATIILQAALFYRHYKQSQSHTEVFPVVDAPPGLVLDISALPAKGSTSAKIVMIEFSDYECPFCARFSNGVARELHEKFIANGKIRYSFANHPLPIHPNALKLAKLAICAGEQNRYWEMHDALFSNLPKSKEAALMLAVALHA